MTILNIAIINDTLLKVINTTKYNENDVPTDQRDIKYVEKLAWMAPGITYGWRGRIRDICGTCETVGEDGQILFDECDYISVKQAELKSELASYRWKLMNGEMIVNGSLIVTDKEGRTELNESIGGYLDLTEEDRPDTISFKKPHAVSSLDWSVFNPVAILNWRSMYSMTNSKYSRDCELAVWILIEDIDTRENIDAFDCVSEFDALLKPLLSEDLTKTAYPKKFWIIDNPIIEE